MKVNFYYNNVWLQRIQNVLRYFPHEIKATRREDILLGYILLMYMNWPKKKKKKKKKIINDNQ